MAFFWGQLPTIYEGLMGDMPGRPPPGDFSNSSQGPRSNPSPYNENEGKGFPASSQATVSQGNMQFSQDAFSLTPLSNALPDNVYQSYNNVPNQRYPSGPSTSPLMFQMPNVQQFANQQAMGQPMANMPYGMGYQPQFQGMYSPSHVQQQQNTQPGLNTGNQFYQSQGFMGQPQQMAPQFLVQPTQYSMQGQVYTGASSSGPYGPRSGFHGGVPAQQRAHEYISSSSTGGTPRRSSSIGEYKALS